MTSPVHLADFVGGPSNGYSLELAEITPVIRLVESEGAYVLDTDTATPVYRWHVPGPAAAPAAPAEVVHVRPAQHQTTTRQQRRR